MLAVAQYVRDQAADGNFEFLEDVVCNECTYNRGNLLDVLNSYDTEDQAENYESCDDTSSSGKISSVPAGRVFRILRQDASSRSTSGRLAPSVAAPSESSTNKAQPSESFHDLCRDLIRA
jgi:hypothetical protein